MVYFSRVVEKRQAAHIFATHLKSSRNTILVSILLVSTLLHAQGCAWFATGMTPTKEKQSSAETRTLVPIFWEHFHNGDYASIAFQLSQWKLAYLKSPHDPKIASTIGFLHAWRVTERARQSELTPNITDDLTMAARYFEASHILEPSNPVTHGFYAAFSLADATIHNNAKKQTRAWFEAKNAMDAWPAFNQFTVAYLMNALPYTEKRGQQATTLLKDVLEDCLQQKPKYVDALLAQQLNRLLTAETDGMTAKRARACNNTFKAPYNIQGFMLNMADTFIRNGDVKIALELYGALKKTSDFNSWPYRHLVADRIDYATKNSTLFKRTPLMTKPDVGMMFTSAYSCMACHQR